MVCEGGLVSLTSDSLQYRPPGAKIKWSLSLGAIEQLQRDPSGYLSSGKIHFQIKEEEARRADKASVTLKVWQCQVCDEINESSASSTKTVTCKICGSVQKGRLLEVNMDSEPAELETQSAAVQWKCDVCEEENEGNQKRCSSCGFPRSEDSEPKKPTTQPTTQAPVIKVSKPRYKLSFKSGGSTVFFDKLQSLHKQQKSQLVCESLTEVAVGISGLLRKQEEKNLATEASLSSAFSDLDALMRSAGEMVSLAAKISDKIRKAEDKSQDDLSSRDRDAFAELVASLGIDEIGVVGAESEGSSLEYYDSIAKSVSGLVQALIEKTGTRVYSLADVFCIFNRTRTSGSLISPADLLKAARRLSKLALPIRLHQFTQKGMLCLVPAQDIDPHHLYALIREIFAEKRESFLTAIDLAQKSKVSLLLAGQQLQMAEMAGKLVRDAKRKDLPAYYNNILLR